MKKNILALICLFSLLSTVLKADLWNDFYWKKMEIVPAKYDLTYWYELYFLPDNPNCGFVCGEQGAFAKTTDGGKTWQASTIDTFLHAESVYFVDENIGYVSGSAGHLEINDTIVQYVYKNIYRTTDGGETWKDITPKELNDLSFIYQGSTWGHHIIDANNIWLAGSNGTTKDIGQIFFKSTNAGESWTYFYTELDSSALTDIKMYDKDGLGYAIGSGMIWETENGGKTWQHFAETPIFEWKPFFKTQYNWHEDLQIYDNSFIIPAAPGTFGNNSSNSEGGLAFSDDNGKTWQTLITNGSMFGTFILNDSVGFGCGQNFEVYYTRNAGKSWTPYTCGISPYAYLDDLWFIDDTTGFVCGNAGIYKMARKKTSIEILGGGEVCEDMPAQLIAVDDFNYFNWYKIENHDTVFVGAGKELDVPEPKSGKYFVEAYDYLCYIVNSELVEIIELKAFDIDIASDKSSYCQGDTAKIYISPASRKLVQNFHWNFNPPEGKYSDTATVTESGTYSLTYIDLKGCKGIASINISLKKLSKPQIKITNVGICYGDTTVIEITNYSDYDESTGLIWYLNDIIIANNVQQIVATSNGDYYVQAIINQDCNVYSDTMTVDMKNSVNALSFAQNELPFFVDSVKYSQMSCRNLKITNNSSQEIVLDDVLFQHKFAFTAPLSQFPFVIKPYNTENLLICYAPTDLNIQTDTISITDNCGNIFIDLFGVGLRNKDSATLDCDVVIYVATKEIIKKKIFVTSTPAPNPSTLLTKINYSLVKQEYDGNIELQMTNYMGRKVDIGYSNNVNAVENDASTQIISGDISINTQQLPAGIYFVQLSYSGIYHLYKIIVQ